MKKNFILLGSCAILMACSNQREKQVGPEATIELELVDSLVVDELSTLTMDDYSPENGHYLLRGTKSRKLLLVDEKGMIIKEYDHLNEGPNGVGTNGAFGYRFLDKNRWIAQGLFNGYHIYNLQGEKLKTVPHNNETFFRMSVYTFRTTFNPYIKNGIPYIVGEEPNSFNPDENDPDKADAAFYQKVRTVYNYNLESEQNELLETYPEEWYPQKSQIYVGASYPFVTYDRKKEELALLPVMGNQLFVYAYSDSLPVLKHTVELTHRFRPKEIPLFDPDADPLLSDYPKFSDLRVLGDYLLVGFHTKIPEDIMREFRAKSEQYYSLPEYKAAHEQYSKPYYLVVKDGKQVGILDKFPVHGNLNLTDENGFIYINDNVSPEVERDYNVFYKLKIKD